MGSVMTSRQAAELDYAFERNGWTAENVKKLSEGNILAVHLRILRGELAVSEPVRAWREQKGVIYFTLPPTDNTAGPQWIERLERKGFRLSKWAKDVLNSPDFQPTTGVMYEIAVLKGLLWKDSDRITSNIQAEAERRNFTKPNAEVACLIREMFTDKEIEAMGLWWIVAMHEPINDSDGDPILLNANRNDDGHWLDTAYGFPGVRWSSAYGFAFVVAQVRTPDSESQA